MNCSSAQDGLAHSNEFLILILILILTNVSNPDFPNVAYFLVSIDQFRPQTDCRLTEWLTAGEF